MLSCLLLVCNGFLYAQTHREQLMDSLLTEAKNVQQDSAGLRLLERISKEYITRNPKEGIVYAQRALAWAENHNDPKRKAVALSLLGSNYNAASDVENAISYNLQALELFTEVGDTEGAASVHSNLSQAYVKIGSHAKALDANFLALEVYEDIERYRQQAIVYENIANIYFELGKMEKSDSYYQKALPLYKDHGSRQDISRCSGNMSRVYIELKEYAKAMTYLETALATNKEIGNTNGVLINHINIGNAFSEQKRYREALDHYRQSLKMSNDSEIPSYIAFNRGNIGAVYLRMYKENTPRNPAVLDSAKTNLQTAIAICDSIGHLPPMLEFMGSQIEAYSLSGDFDKAYTMLQEKTTLNDSLHSLEAKQQLAELETKRAIDLKNKDLVIKEREREIAALNSQKSTMRLVLVIVVLVMALLIAFDLYRRKSRKHRRILSEIKQMQSHEIRGPIATILGLTQLLKKQGKSNTEKERLVAGIEEMANKLNRIVVKIIQNSKNER